ARELRGQGLRNGREVLAPAEEAVEEDDESPAVTDASAGDLIHATGLPFAGGR
ncbi:UNVERIFIED_CONTAM: hypothetical protein ITH50_25195, partial [Salmonella enterica subsp. enterica serovar Weltevreden]